METGKFIETVKQFPQVWDRNCVTFREPSLKNEAWERIAKRMGCSAGAAKDTFKSLREKYVREREKQSMFGEKYTPWQYMKSLSFLDPHIILRKMNPTTEAQARMPQFCPQSIEDESFAQISENNSDFDKMLIALVKKATPIWDRKSNEYPSKQVKYQLWKEIAQVMNKDVNACMMRWKGLREKYIRQKNKYQEGDGKWQFLDDLAFLDGVIQYRRKHYESGMGYRQSLDSDFHFHQNSNEVYEDSFVYDSSNDFAIQVKTEDDVQDNSYDVDSSSSGRKRSTSDNSESTMEKMPRYEDPMKSPERMFGELVAAMLAKKTERERNVAMIEIMKVLTK